MSYVSKFNVLGKTVNVKDEEARLITDNIRSYKGNTKAWNVTRVLDHCLQSQRFVFEYTPEAYVDSKGTVICYLGETKELPLDYPVNDGVPHVSLDSYLGVGASGTVLNNCMVKFKPIFYDKDASGNTIITSTAISVSGVHALPPDYPQYHPSVKRDEVINICKSYYDTVKAGRKWKYGPNFVTYSKNSVVNNAEGAGMMECDSFVSMVMLGIPYNKSPYFDETPDKHFNFEDMVINPDSLTWCLPWQTSPVFNRKLTWTGGQNWWLWYNKMVFSSYDDIVNGDIVIFTKPGIKYFDGIKHIGIIDIVRENGLKIPYIYHFTGLTNDPMRYEPLSDVITRGGYKNNEVYFARPNYL